MPGRCLFWSALISAAGVLVSHSAQADELTELRQRGTLVWGGDSEGGGPYVYPDPHNPRRMAGFEVELADMLVGYRVLRGPDPLATARVRAPELRRQLERELRGKLLRLRQGYTLVGDDPAGMGELALRSAPTVLVLLRGVLAMVGAPPAVAPADVVSGAEAATGLGLQPIGAAAAHRHEPRWECSQQEFLNYTAAVTSVADFVDRFDPGEPR